MPHPLGDLVRVRESEAALLAYFRSNVLHLFALPALVACLLGRNRRLDARRMDEAVAGIYTLLRADKTEAVRSRKESFCLANTDAVDYTVPGADWRPENTDLHTACGDRGTVSLREVLASGSGDTYSQFRAGQAFRIDTLPNGIYYISVEGNPNRNLVEADTTNNVALRKIKLSGKPQHRKLKVFPVGIIDDSGYGYDEE